MSQAKILIISDSNLHSDPRVLVQIETLNQDYDLTCLGRTHPKIDGLQFVKLSKGNPLVRLVFKGLAATMKRLGRFASVKYFDTKSRHAVKALKGERFDLILCNDIPSAPMAAWLRSYTGGGLYVDAHEFTPQQWVGRKGFEKERPYLDYVMKAYVANADFGTTVCQSIADHYTHDYGFKIDEVVMNMPAYKDLQPKEVDDSKIRIVHHGIANRSRRLDNLVDLMSYLDERFTLDFYLGNVGDNAYKDLVAYAEKDSRITFRDPVPTAELPQVLNQYDIGLYPLPPTVPNQALALPNKFFEFVQARLALAIWPSVEMKRLLDQYDLGVSSSEFDIPALAAEVQALSKDDIMRYKRNSDSAAKVLHAENSVDKIRSGVKKVLGGQSS